MKAEGGFSGKERERDGKLFFLDTQGSSTQLISIDEAAGEVKNYAKPGLNIVSACLWREGFAVSAMRGNSGCELMYIAPDGAETVLTDFNAAICAEYAYSAPEPLSFVNSEGRMIEGWVIKP